jgi:hypothetical protein
VCDDDGAVSIRLWCRNGDVQEFGPAFAALLETLEMRTVAAQKKKHGSLKFHGGEAWGRGVQGAFGAYSGCILPSLVVSSLSRPRSLLFASCCLLFWRVFVRSLREHAGFKEGSLRRLRSFILAIFASKDGRRS